MNTHHWFLQCDPASMSCRPMPLRTASEYAEEFRKAERTPYSQTFIIVRRKDNVPVGRARFFDYNTHNRSAEIGLLIDPEEQKKGVGKAAINLMCQYLFNVRGLNKVYAQTASFNVGAIRLLEHSGFHRDGVLRRHYFYQGEFHDGVIYSLLQYEFE